MQQRRQDEKGDSHGNSERTTSKMPPCCGSQCAVCLLDYWVDDVPSLMPHDDIANDHHLNNCTAVELPACCNTGCLVCVLDYPELFLNPESEAEMTALLEAFERSQNQD